MGHGFRVVVVGAGPAGLLAATAVAEHADEVLVLDRDRLPQEPVPRDGVPQDRHWNRLDRAGLGAIETLLPGLTHEAVAAGGRRGRKGLVIRRPLLEALVRRRVAAVPTIRLLHQTAALDLAQTPGSQRVSGVVVTELERATTVQLSADLVIDASGQHTRSPAWLARRGIEVSEMRVGLNATFVTREFTRRPRRIGPGVSRHVVPAPRGARGWDRAAVVASLGDEWLLTLAGSHGLRPPTDLPGFSAYAAGVSASLGAVLSGASAVGEAAVHRLPSTVTRQASGTSVSLEGLVMVGDAWRTLDPLDGQGMSEAARSAVMLGELAAETPVDRLGAAWVRQVATAP